MFDCAPKGSTSGLNELKAKFAEGKHSIDACGGCGAKKGEDDAALLACGKCKKRQYCGKECQAKHWKLHKKVCEAPNGGKENAQL